MIGNTRGDGEGIVPTVGNRCSEGGDSMHGAARASKPAVSKSSIATIAWALLSLALIAGGLTYCSKRLESTTVKSGTIRGITKLLHRMRMIQGDFVRVKNGEFADISPMIRSAQRNFGHANSIAHSGPGGEDEDAGPYGGGFYDDDVYDGNQNASGYDDEGGDDLPRSSQGGGRPGQRPNTPLAKRPASGSAATKTALPKTETEAERKAAVEKKAFDDMAARKNAQRAKYAEERRKRGLELFGESGERKGRRPERRQAAQRPMEHREHDSDDRFPGDAGTMKDENRDELARMEAEGLAAQTHRRKSQLAYEEASRMRMERRKPDVQTKQMGNNNLQDEIKKSPGDPDNQPPSLKVERIEEERPKLERKEFQQNTSGAKKGSEEGAVGMGAADADTADSLIQELRDRLAQLQKDKETGEAGGRAISSVEGA